MVPRNRCLVLWIQIALRPICYFPNKNYIATAGIELNLLEQMLDGSSNVSQSAPFYSAVIGHHLKQRIFLQMVPW